MALTQRFGSLGSYWGNDYYSSDSLTTEQMQLNARYIYRYFLDKGWTVNAIAGILGNMQHESAINPGRWEGNNVLKGPGYGLVQWTPYTNHTNWCTEHSYSDPSTMDANLAHIMFELENGGQYYATDNYPESFEEFTKSTKDSYYLACAFAWNYERSAVVLWGTPEEQEALRQTRGGSARTWYDFLGGVPSTPDKDKKKKKNKYKFIIFNKRRKMYG